MDCEMPVESNNKSILWAIINDTIDSIKFVVQFRDAQISSNLDKWTKPPPLQLKITGYPSARQPNTCHRRKFLDFYHFLRINSRRRRRRRLWLSGRFVFSTKSLMSIFVHGLWLQFFESSRWATQGGPAMPLQFLYLWAYHPPIQHYNKSR